jgi:hypothetical protein
MSLMLAAILGESTFTTIEELEDAQFARCAALQGTA